MSETCRFYDSHRSKEYNVKRFICGKPIEGESINIWTGDGFAPSCSGHKLESWKCEIHKVFVSISKECPYCTMYEL